MAPSIESLASLDEVVPLLRACELPVADLSGESQTQFFGLRQAGALVAVVGLQLFPPLGLLRSLAVAPGVRRQGWAQRLVRHAEDRAAAQGVETVYLLTTTAESYFLQCGYGPTPRQAAPLSIRTTAQFSGLCPSSSAFLSKRIGGALAADQG